MKVKKEYYHTGERMYTCKDCQNTWSKKEFVIKTNQCKVCKKWDDDKPERDKEFEFRMNTPKVDFPYVAGDPFW